MSPLRFLTPGQLGICLVLFFLPWVDVQCAMPKDLGLNFDKAGAAPPPKTPELVWSSFLTQSGLQAATGGYSFSNPQFRAMAEMDKGGGKAKGGKDEGPDPAPLLWAYLGAVVAGIVVGFAVPSGTPRKLILAGCCVLALAAAGGQAVLGFPMRNAVEKDLKEGKGGFGAGGLNLDVPGPGGPADPAGPKPPVKPSDVVKVKLQLWYFLALLFAVGALVTALIEPTRAGAGKKPARRRYEDEDDEVGEAEPLPLDDEEDDRPRRGRARSREDEDDRPRRRDRGDDDRPRRERDRDEPRGRGGRDDGGRRGGSPRKEDPDNPFANLE